MTRKDVTTVDEVKKGIRNREQPLGIRDSHYFNLVRGDFGFIWILLNHKDSLYKLKGLYRGGIYMSLPLLHGRRK
jgi:hypothetical protein